MANGSIKIGLSIAAAISLAACGPVARKDGIQTFESAYNSILIQKKDSVVEMRFRRRGAEYLESAIDLRRPLDLIVPYTRTFFVGVFFQPHPNRVLLIGLGGGGFNRLFNAAFPSAVLDSVELDPKIVELAKSEMDFHETPSNRVTVSDGRIFLKRNSATYDWIILDAFRGGYVPSHLKTQEFYTLVRTHMTENGILLANLHGGTALFPSDVVTLRTAFSKVSFFCTKPSGNVIAVATQSATLDLESRVREFEPRLANAVLREHLDLEELKRQACLIAPETGAQVLTDDFSPAEYLDAISRENRPKY
jgi:spermidine synthase